MDNLSVEELALQRKRFAHLSDDEFRFMLQQVEGRQRTRDKLPTFAQIEDWWYPVRLSCEQCSSEATARYKAQRISSLLSNKQFSCTDLTGGYGVDTYFMSEHASEAHYVERNEELCRIARHNFANTRPQVQIHNTDSVSFLQNMHTCDVAYIDPARRNPNGGKVFRIEDCEPNIIELLDCLLSKCELLAIKLSPMLDISAALKSMNKSCLVDVVAVRNEVKEVLIIIQKAQEIPTKIRAINITSNDGLNADQCIEFSLEEEKDSTCSVYDNSFAHLAKTGAYIYEPNAAIIKAGAFKLVAQRYQLCKMSPNTHLYLSQHLVEDFPGRVWQIIESNIKDAKDTPANILTRNYPLTPEQLRKKLKVKDSDTHTIIGARLADKPTLFLCKKI